jgi:hypothetical protein
MPDIWREVVLKTIKEKAWKEGKFFGIWVIQKVRNDTSVSVTVRAGMAYTDKVTGEKRYPKDGFTDWDLEALRKKNEAGVPIIDEIMPLLDRKNPPPVAPVEEPSP